MTDFERLTDFGALLEAHRQCQKGKRWKDSVAVFCVRNLEYIDKLQESLLRGTYCVSRYHTFRLSERGKLRTIKATRYADRIVLRSLCDNVLTPRVAQTFISANGASQRRKGTDYMRCRLRDDLRAYVSKHGADGYVLVGDLSGFFDSIPHEYLNALYRHYIDDERVLQLIEGIHATLPDGHGLPLGNQTSQVGALLAGSGLDHFVKEHLHIKGYGRYMDDFYLIHPDKTYLAECLRQIETYLTEIGLKLNKKKTRITTLRNGITYLGFRFSFQKPAASSSKPLRVKPLLNDDGCEKLKERVDAWDVSYDQARQSYQAWRAGVSARKKDGTKRAFRPDTYYMVQQMDLYFYQLFEDWLTDEDRKAYAALKDQIARQKRRTHEQSN